MQAAINWRIVTMRSKYFELSISPLNALAQRRFVLGLSFATRLLGLSIADRIPGYMNLPIDIPQQAVVIRHLRTDTGELHLGTGCYLGWNDRLGAFHETELTEAQMNQLVEFLNRKALELPLYLL
jgi:hypothetical protein